VTWGPSFMIKAVSAIAIAALVAAALALLPGFAPEIKASLSHALDMGNWLDIRLVTTDWSQQTWPNFEPACLKVAGSNSPIKQARLVTADRTP